MKSYTDIEQSRKLAEILPIESADMSWVVNGFGKPFARTIPCKGYEEEICPCWSLAALFNVFHIAIDGCIPTLRRVGSSFCCAYSSKSSNGDWLWFYADNPVDACYEMILKLHELKML